MTYKETALNNWLTKWVTLAELRTFIILRKLSRNRLIACLMQMEMSSILIQFPVYTLDRNQFTPGECARILLGRNCEIGRNCLPAALCKPPTNIGGLALRKQIVSPYSLLFFSPLPPFPLYSLYLSHTSSPPLPSPLLSSPLFLSLPHPLHRHTHTLPITSWLMLVGHCLSLIRWHLLLWNFSHTLVPSFCTKLTLQVYLSWPMLSGWS